MIRSSQGSGISAWTSQRSRIWPRYGRGGRRTCRF